MYQSDARFLCFFSSRTKFLSAIKNFQFLRSPKKKIFMIADIGLVMIYAVYTTKSLDKETEKLTKEEQERIGKIFLQLKENPYVGDQLQYRHLREKRIKEKRVYYLVYDDLQAVLVVAVSEKKNQQTTINHIIDNFDEYKEYLEKLIGEN